MTRPTISDDDRWDMGMRLRQARQRRFRTIREAAKAMDINESTLKGYEIGTRAISRENIKLFAQQLRAPLIWLEWGLGSLDGEDSMVRGTRLVPMIGTVTTGARIEPDHANGHAIGTVELPFAIPGDDDYGSLRIANDSMLPAYLNDTVIVVRKTTDQVRTDLIGRMALVVLYDGRRYFRQVKRGSHPGTYTLQHWGSADLEDVWIESAAEVLCKFPPGVTAIRVKENKPYPADRRSNSHLAWLKSDRTLTRERQNP